MPLEPMLQEKQRRHQRPCHFMEDQKSLTEIVDQFAGKKKQAKTRPL